MAGGRPGPGAAQALRKLSAQLVSVLRGTKVEPPDFFHLCVKEVATAIKDLRADGGSSRDQLEALRQAARLCHACSARQRWLKGRVPRCAGWRRG